MATGNKPPANAFVARARKIYHPLGFSKGYNFVLWFIFSGALLGFVLARLQYLNFFNVFCSPGSGGSNHAAPGECFYYLRGREKIGMISKFMKLIAVYSRPCGSSSCLDSETGQMLMSSGLIQCILRQSCLLVFSSCCSSYPSSDINISTSIGSMVTSYCCWHYCLRLEF